jgi:hypothetical protein
MNPYYTPSGTPATGSQGSSANMRSELALIEDGFDLLPSLTGNANKLIGVNSGETALEAKTSPSPELLPRWALIRSL